MTDGQFEQGQQRKQRMRDASEAAIQRTICAYLTYAKYCFAVTNRERVWSPTGHVRSSRISMPGWPDITACVKGRFVGLEVKSRTGRLRPEQKACHEALRAAGGVVEVVRSLDEVVAILGRI